MSPPPYLAILDDDAAVGRALKRLLKPLLLNVRTFTSPTEFFHAVAERPPECLLLDLQMPEMGGLEVQEQLLALGHPFPIIFISAHQDEALRRQALEGGAAGFVAKPFDRRALLELVAAARGGAADAASDRLRLRARPGQSAPLSTEPGKLIDFELTDLLPCPFCRGFARLENDCVASEDDGFRYWARAMCSRCGANIPSQGGAAFATALAANKSVAERWNRRAEVAL